MDALKVTKKSTIGNFTYSVMEGEKGIYVHINNNKTGKNSVIVKLEDILKAVED